MPSLGSDDIDRILENTPLPNPQEQADLLILRLGQNTKGLGDFETLSPKLWMPIIGAWHEANVGKLVQELAAQGLIKQENFPNVSHPGLTLTMSGWARFQELQRGATQSRKAFMAMPYGNILLDGVYTQCFKPAVKAAGFDLFRLDEQPRAGVIDNRIRVDIRTARFLIADLTNENRGAYWEAGFAEGLDKPVIYTCERSYFDAQKTHFDTNHCTTIVWSQADLESAARNLTATIRKTLPTEAKLEGE